MKQHDLKLQITMNTLLIILSALILIPFLVVVSISISNEKDIVYHGYKFIPERFDFSAYSYVFRNPQSIIQAYKITAIFSVVTTFLSVLLMAFLAYPLSQRALKGRNYINFFIYFTMLFNGGLVPTYILNTQYLHLGNTIWIYILPALILPWFVFMMRTFFAQIPEEIHESAIIDGANEFHFLFKMLLPLSKPVLATLALFTLLGRWNDWFTSLLYIDDQKLVSLQYFLQRIMNNITLIQETSSHVGSMVTHATPIPTEAVRMAMAVIVAGPAILVFPFFQKYFVKGLTVGSVKG